MEKPKPKTVVKLQKPKVKPKPKKAKPKPSQSQSQRQSIVIKIGDKPKAKKQSKPRAKKATPPIPRVLAPTQQFAQVVYPPQIPAPAPAPRQPTLSDNFNHLNRMNERAGHATGNLLTAPISNALVGHESVVAQEKINLAEEKRKIAERKSSIKTGMEQVLRKKIADGAQRKRFEIALTEQSSKLADGVLKEIADEAERDFADKSFEEQIAMGQQRIDTRASMDREFDFITGDFDRQATRESDARDRAEVGSVLRGMTFETTRRSLEEKLKTEARQERRKARAESQADLMKEEARPDVRESEDRLFFDMESEDERKKRKIRENNKAQRLMIRAEKTTLDSVLDDVIDMFISQQREPISLAPPTATRQNPLLAVPVVSENPLMAIRTADIPSVMGERVIPLRRSKRGEMEDKRRVVVPMGFQMREDDDTSFQSLQQEEFDMPEQSFVFA